MLTYESVSSASRRGLFLVLHPNIALSESVFEQALSLHFIRILPSGKSEGGVALDMNGALYYYNCVGNAFCRAEYRLLCGEYNVCFVL